MLVKYIGRNNIFTVERNGKRFCFRKGDEPIDIPVEAYDMIKQSGHVDAPNVIPVQEVRDNPILVKENEELKSRIKELETKIKELSKKKEKSDAKKK